MSASLPTEYSKLFIGGQWTQPSTDQVIEVHSPATGEYVGKVPMSAKADVDAAVADETGGPPMTVETLQYLSSLGSLSYAVDRRMF